MSKPMSEHAGPDAPDTAPGYSIDDTLDLLQAFTETLKERLPGMGLFVVLLPPTPANGGTCNNLVYTSDTTRERVLEALRTTIQVIELARHEQTPGERAH